MAEHDDVGRRALHNVRRVMNVDHGWSLTDDRSFTWWGKDFAQRVSVTEPVESAGVQVAKLVAMTAVVEGVAINADTYQKLSALNADGCTLSALVLNKAGVVSYVASATVREDTLTEVSAAFAVIAAMQAADAHTKADALARELEGRPARQPHPIGGARPDWDDALQVIERLVAPHSEQSSAWTGDDMLDTLAILQRTSLLATGDAAGLVAEFPYGGFSSLLSFNTEGRHPHLGHGLHVTLRIPEKPSALPAHAAAGFLNELEAELGVLTDFTGSWCVGSEDTLTFTAFYPNAFFKRGSGLNVALSMEGRADWIAAMRDGGTREERWAAGRPAAAPLRDVSHDATGGHPVPATPAERIANWLRQIMKR